MTDGLSAEPELDTEDIPEVEWVGVEHWPAQSVMLKRDIAGIKDVLALMEGAADDVACHLFTDFLHAALLSRRRELAGLILSHHGIEIPEQADFVTPQQRMSDQLRHVREVVEQRRQDIVPDKQPFTDRYGPGRPGLQAMTPVPPGEGPRGMRLHGHLPSMGPPGQS